MCITFCGSSLFWTPLGQKKVSLIERCPHFKMYIVLMFGTAQAVLIRGVSLFQWCCYFRGVLTSGASLFQVSLFQGCPYFRGVLISECPYFKGVLISGMSLFQGHPNFRASLFQGCPYFRDVLISGVSL